MEPKIIEFLKKKEKEIENFNAPKNLIINGEYQIGFMGREAQLHFDTTIDLTNIKEVPIKPEPPATKIFIFFSVHNATKCAILI